MEHDTMDGIADSLDGKEILKCRYCGTVYESVMDKLACEDRYEKLANIELRPGSWYMAEDRYGASRWIFATCINRHLDDACCMYNRIDLGDGTSTNPYTAILVGPQSISEHYNLFGKIPQQLIDLAPIPAQDLLWYLDIREACMP